MFIDGQDDNAAGSSNGSAGDDIDLAELGFSPEEIAELEKEAPSEEQKKGDEKPKSRASERIQQLVRENKELKAKQSSPAFSPTDLKKVVSEAIEEREKAKEASTAKAKKAEEFQKELATLEKEFDGSNDLPKFDRVAVLKWGNEHQVYNLRIAYEKMHEDKILSHKLKTKEKPNFTKEGGGTDKGKEVKTPSFTDGSLKQSMLEKVKGLKKNGGE